MSDLFAERSGTGSFADDIISNRIEAINALAGIDSLNRIEQLSVLLPKSFSPFWGYEIPLTNPAYSCDFLCCIDDPKLFRKLFDPDSPLVNHPEFLHRESYVGLQRLASAWSEPGGVLCRSINNLWFEYDSADLFDSLPVPNFFYGPKPVTNPFDTVVVCEKLFQLLGSNLLKPATYRLLFNCITNLQKGSYISQIGMMLARSDHHLRLFIQGIATNQIASVLKKLGYKHADDAVLLNLLKDCYSIASQVDLDIDLLEETGEKIGLECYFDTMERAERFLQYLHEKELCAGEKFLILRHHLKLIRYNERNEHQHFFSHFKLVFGPGADLKAKAYLGFAHQSVARHIIRTKTLIV